MTQPGKSICVVGAGNIGSHLLGHLARLPGIERIVLIDPQVYERSNLASQEITQEALGTLKAVYQARRLRRINPALGVLVKVRRVEDVPLGHLRAAAILSAVDTRRTRRYLNEVAWRLGVPLIDAGVGGGGLLVRLQVVMPGEDDPCLECSWDDQDYTLMEQDYPCSKALDAAPSTQSLSCLGSLAASLQAIECYKLLSGCAAEVARGRQIVIEAGHHQFYATRVTRNPNCRFDHDVWQADATACSEPDTTLEEVLVPDDPDTAPHGGVFMQVHGKKFVRRLACPQCGDHKKIFRLQGRLGRKEQTCGRCGAALLPVGFYMLERLEGPQLSRPSLRRSLRSLGLRPGDMYSVEGPQSTVRRFEICCDRGSTGNGQKESPRR